jgi:undecaprenyl-phosphate 4-deoxy-4-formamido-L-arabinose transferase
MQISIVVPVYRSADCLRELARKVNQHANSHFQNYELILVNDNSPDASWDVIVELTAQYEFVTGVNLRKNVGQDNAIMAGLHYASGEVIIIMDDDLQHDPSDIASLCKEIEKGFDVVYASFVKKEQAAWKNAGSWFADHVARVLLGKPKDIYMSPYKAIRREVIEEIIKYDGPYSYIDGLILTITRNLSQIPATHYARFAGTGNYNVLKSIGVWLKLATSFSAIPLRLIMLLGAIISVLSFVMGFYFVLKTLLWEQMPEGWPSLIVVVFFLGGIQLMGLGAIGEYVARIFITQNKRPQFTVAAIQRHNSLVSKLKTLAAG